MEISAFKKDHLPEAAALFVQNFKRLRQRVPILPDGMENPDRVVKMLDRLFDACPGVVALDRGRLVGYLGGFVIDGFRDTERQGAYCPEWGQAAQDDGKNAIYRALYREAAALWTDAGCQVHAISLLAHDAAAEKSWFWNGFGLLCVDAIRPLTPVDAPSPAGIRIRQAARADADLLALLDAEHWQHYAKPPILMMYNDTANSAAFAEFLDQPKNSVWLAMHGDHAVGYMRFQERNSGAASIVNGETNIALTSAYVRPAYRGQKAAVALMNATFEHYSHQGIDRCSVDFESINPEASAFWTRHFELVSLSVTRIPERNKFS